MINGESELLPAPFAVMRMVVRKSEGCDVVGHRNHGMIYGWVVFNRNLPVSVKTCILSAPRGLRMNSCPAKDWKNFESKDPVLINYKREWAGNLRKRRAVHVASADMETESDLDFATHKRVCHSLCSHRLLCPRYILRFPDCVFRAWLPLSVPATPTCLPK